MTSDTLYNQKYSAAEKALSYIDNNMLVGLGTGSTANIFIDLLAAYQKKHQLNLQCVATSKVSHDRAVQQGLTMLENGQTDYLDIAIDGTDEFDPEFRLIKGGGGALLREKIIASAAKKFIVITDHTKQVDDLGAFPLPIECVNYEHTMLKKQLEKIYHRHASPDAPEFSPILRKNKHNNSIFLTDLGHNIIDLSFHKICDPESLAHDLQGIAGIIDHGLFLNEAQVILTNDHVLNK